MAVHITAVQNAAKMIEKVTGQPATTADVALLLATLVKIDEQEATTTRIINAIDKFGVRYIQSAMAQVNAMKEVV